MAESSSHVVLTGAKRAYENQFEASANDSSRCLAVETSLSASRFPVVEPPKKEKRISFVNCSSFTLKKTPEE